MRPLAHLTPVLTAALLLAGSARAETGAVVDDEMPKRLAPVAAPPAAANAEEAAGDEEEDATALAAAADTDDPGIDALPAPAPDFVLPDLSVLVAEPVRGIESSGFGWRDDPIRHRRRYHKGNDFRAPRGTPVYAAGDGVIVGCRRHHGYGRMVDVRHGPGLVTRYAHLQKIEVTCGQRVAADDVIGLVGSTGRATGPHLHFEVRLHGNAVDPALAVRVGRMQLTDPPDVVWTTARELRPEVQSEVTSPLDPPRTRASDRKPERKHTRRPSVS